MTQPSRALAKPGPNRSSLETIRVGAGGLEISNAAQLYSTCEAIAATEMVPERLRNKPAAIFAVAMLGMPLGFDFMTSIRRIEMFSGKPTLPAELMLAVILRQHDRVHYAKGYKGNPYEDDFCAWIETQRKGGPICRTEFSVRDAKTAGLWEKKGPWQNYPKRMLHARCVGDHARDYWADRMNGLQPSEDYEPAPPMRDVTPTQGVRLDLDQSEPGVDPLLQDVVDVEPEPEIDRSEKLTMLGEWLNLRAAEINADRAALKAQLLAKAGVDKGASPTDQQIDNMLALVATIDLGD